MIYQVQINTGAMTYPVSNHDTQAEAIAALDQLAATELEPAIRFIKVGLPDSEMHRYINKSVILDANIDVMTLPEEEIEEPEEPVEEDA